MRKGNREGGRREGEGGDVVIGGGGKGSSKLEGARRKEASSVYFGSALREKFSLGGRITDMYSDRRMY